MRQSSRFGAKDWQSTMRKIIPLSPPPSKKIYIYTDVFKSNQIGKEKGREIHEKQNIIQSVWAELVSGVLIYLFIMPALTSLFLGVRVCRCVCGWMGPWVGTHIIITHYRYRQTHTPQGTRRRFEWCSGAFFCPMSSFLSVSICGCVSVCVCVWVCQCVRVRRQSHHQVGGCQIVSVHTIPFPGFSQWILRDHFQNWLRLFLESSMESLPQFLGCGSGREREREPSNLPAESLWKWGRARGIQWYPRAIPPHWRAIVPISTGVSGQESMTHPAEWKIDTRDATASGHCHRHQHHPMPIQCPSNHHPITMKLSSWTDQHFCCHPT